ncbi:MAG: glycosyltransferase [Candidatus Sungiibacteriota bacterium]|uniref:Glycosyltransferase n=1 Tax=Candidatus Sungiibacteriota bacterium TaxID=2750080 RepID=A0A7T5UQC6_9BACT|nr:MAG: glycosyltransferase [Candidatus Sungbacteria bacterium]
MYLSWIIPAYNEEKRIEKTLREVDSYLQSKGFAGGYEIIVVNAASRDRTAQIVNGLRQTVPNLQLFDVDNRGKGWAVKQGMLTAQGDLRLFSDADNSTAPNYFDKMEPFLRQGYDVVISSRNSKDVVGASRDVKEPWYREILGLLGNLMIQVFGVWGIWDTQNGFKACNAGAAKEIFSRTLMYGFSFDIEMLALAKRLKYKIGIIPVRWRFETESKVTLASYLKVFFDVFRIRWNLVINKYHL